MENGCKEVLLLFGWSWLALNLGIFRITVQTMHGENSVS